MNKQQKIMLNGRKFRKKQQLYLSKLGGDYKKRKFRITYWSEGEKVSDIIDAFTKEEAVAIFKSGNSYVPLDYKIKRI